MHGRFIVILTGNRSIPIDRSLENVCEQVHSRECFPLTEKAIIYWPVRGGYGGQDLLRRQRRWLSGYAGNEGGDDHPPQPCGVHGIQRVGGRMPARDETMIERIMRVLEAFGTGESALTASEIARRTKLPTATAYRIVGDMVASKVLEREPDRRVHIGLRLWELATRASSALSLRDIALPYMEDLHAVVRQHTQLSVLDRHDVLYLERLSSKHATAANATTAGSRLPALQCAPGVVLAAYSPPAVRDELLTWGKLTAFNKQTVMDRDELRKIIAQARRAGYALVPGWIHDDVTGIAVPILAADGGAIAALSIIIERGADELTYIHALQTTARAISRAMHVENLVTDPRLNLLKQQIRRATEGD
jgi:DNA-binding IclR family transcriptional regulator